jgi:plastocyanin
VFVAGVIGPTAPGAPGSESAVFTSPGTYQVECQVHIAEGMVATIYVQ